MNNLCRDSYDSLEGLQKLHPEFASNSIYYPDYSSPLFKSNELGNYQLLKSSPVTKAGSELPENIKKLLKATRKYVGAYPY